MGARRVRGVERHDEVIRAVLEFPLTDELLDDLLAVLGRVPFEPQPLGDHLRLNRGVRGVAGVGKNGGAEFVVHQRKCH